MYLDNVIYTLRIDALTMVDPLTGNGVIECKQCTPTMNNVTCISPNGSFYLGEKRDFKGNINQRLRQLNETRSPKFIYCLLVYWYMYNI